MAGLVGIIGAMDIEIEKIVNAMTDTEEKTISGIKFVKGSINGNEAVCAVCGILWIPQRRAVVALPRRSRGAAPVPREGLFNICFHFRLRRSPHWGHVFSKCPSTRARVIDPGPFFCAVLRGSRPRYPPSPSSSLPHQTNAWSRTYSPYKT